MGGDAGLGDASFAFGGITEPASHPEAIDHIDDSAGARAQEYALLSALLARAPDVLLLNRLARLEGDGTDLGRAHKALAEAAAMADAAAVAREYFDLFIGVGRGELLPYGSYYQTGFLHERPLAILRADLVYLGEVLHLTDRARTLANCARVLRPGGHLLVVEGFMPERV